MTPEQAKALRESATNIIAHEKSLENSREKLQTELDKVAGNARQAVMMAEEASQAGEADKAAAFSESAEALATHMVGIEQQIAAIDIELIEARQASAEAKSMASDSALKTAAMQAKGAEVRAEFEQAKMAEATLDASGTPSYDEVKDKINTQLAHAEAQAELADADGTTALESATAMVEKAATESKAAAKLAEIRSSMGIASHEPVDDAPTDDAPVDAEPSLDDTET
jgi:phage shock protein A